MSLAEPLVGEVFSGPSSSFSATLGVSLTGVCVLELGEVDLSRGEVICFPSILAVDKMGLRKAVDVLRVTVSRRMGLRASEASKKAPRALYCRLQ